MTFDASVTEPCAYHIGLDQTWAGAGPAEYLAEELGGKGSIIVMGGYPGHYIDHARTDGAMEVFSQYPDIEILVHAYSNWNNAHARQELLARNCNTYHTDLGVPPNYFVDVWHPWVSDLDLFSALEGKVPEGQ